MERIAQHYILFIYTNCMCIDQYPDKTHIAVP